jgi:flagellar biosynthesis/type III secretory pathway chaperone
MNEKVKRFLIACIIGIILGSSITYFLYQRSSSDRAEQYRTAELANAEDNNRLREQLSDVETRLQQYKGFNVDAKRILSSQASSIDKLRALIESLPE